MLSRKLYIALFYIRQHRLTAMVAFMLVAGATGFLVYQGWQGKPAEAKMPVMEKMQDLQTPMTGEQTAEAAKEAALSVPGRTYENGPLPQAYSSCVEYEVINQWENGFIADVTVLNNTSAPLENWTVGWEYRDGQTIQNAWNAQIDITEASSSMKLKNVPWNGRIEPEGSVTFGFQGSYTGKNSLPTGFTLNGTSCEDLKQSSIKKKPGTSNVKTGTLQKIASCRIEYTVQSERLDNFSADIAVTADAAEPITDWRIEMELEDTQSLISLWNGNAWQDGQMVAVLPVSFNKVLAENQPLTFGFTLNGTTMPKQITMNGTTCTLEEAVEEVMPE